MSKFRINELIVDSTLTVIVAEALDWHATETNSGAYFYGSIRPVAVVAHREDGISAWDMQARPTSVEQLRHDIPELDAVIVELACSGR